MAASFQGRKRVLLLVASGMTALTPLACGNHQGADRSRGATAAQPESAQKQDAGNAQPVLALGNSARPAPPRDRNAEATAVAAIEKLDGRVQTAGADKVVVKVDLSRKAVSDADLAHLSIFSSLQELDLHAPDITDAGLQYLQGLSNLRTLDLNFTSITGPGLVHLRGLKNLTELDLGFSHLQDAGLEYLSGLSRLEILNLKLTSVSDAGLQHLKTLAKLQQLDVRLTRVTEAGVKGLKQALPKLQVDY